MTRGGKKRHTFHPPRLAVEIRKRELTRCLLPARKYSSLSTAETAPTKKGLKSLPNRPKKIQVTGFVLTCAHGKAFWLSVWELAGSCKQGAAFQSLNFYHVRGRVAGCLTFSYLSSRPFLFFHSRFNASLEKISSFLHTLGWCVHFLPKKWIFFRILYILIYSWLIV